MAGCLKSKDPMSPRFLLAFTKASHPIFFSSSTSFSMHLPKSDGNWGTAALEVSLRLLGFLTGVFGRFWVVTQVSVDGMGVGAACGVISSLGRFTTGSIR